MEQQGPEGTPQHEVFVDKPSGKDSYVELSAHGCIAIQDNHRQLRNTHTSAHVYTTDPVVMPNAMPINQSEEQGVRICTTSEATASTNTSDNKTV